MHLSDRVKSAAPKNDEQKGANPALDWNDFRTGHPRSKINYFWY